jgi:hypothetical protein
MKVDLLRPQLLMNSTTERHNATIIIVPSTAIETMRLGGLAGVTALTATLGRERAAGAPGPWATPAKP